MIPDCGHSITIKCKSSPERKHCTKKCERILNCGHICKNSCAKECSNEDCQEIIWQKHSTLACGHKEVYVLCCDKYKGNIFYFFIGC